MITVDEAMNHARNELERAFEKWLTDECPSGDCESVQEQWDDSFAHQELVDELQPVMVLTFEVHQLREQAANNSIQIELLEHKLESFREENERLKADAGLIEWQPIETAPKNGTDILVMTGETMHVVRWINIHGDFDYWAVDDNKHGPFTLRGKAPTHWMPLPEPPK